MSTKTQTAEFLVEQLGAGVTAKKMFGEYGLYLEGRLFAMLCDDLLFVKTTPGGRELIARDGEVKEEPPYPGAKNALVVDSTRWDNAEWMTELAEITARELPAPVSKHAKAGKRPPILSPRPASPKPPDPQAAQATQAAVAAKPAVAAARPAAPAATSATKPRAASPSAAPAATSASKPRTAVPSAASASKPKSAAVAKPAKRSTAR